MRETVAIVLAAGEGTRMKSNSLPKVLHPICWKPMLGYILETIRASGIKKTLVVTGFKSELVKKYLGRTNKNLMTVKQKRLMGTADAINCARGMLKNFKGDVLVLYGDMPLITGESLSKVTRRHQVMDASCTILTAEVKNPTGFGRVARDERGRIVRIVEEQDASLYEKVIEEVNVGAYCFRAEDLFFQLKKIKPNNTKAEYYLTDVISLLSRENKKIESVSTNNLEETFGVSSRKDLIKAQEIIRMRTLDKLISEGITIVDPQTTYIDDRVKVCQETVIHPFTIIEGDVSIGHKCSIGPFCRIQGRTQIADEVEVKNFAQVLNSFIGSGSVIAHHAFLKDARLPSRSVIEGAPAKVKKIKR